MTLSIFFDFVRVFRAFRGQRLFSGSIRIELVTLET